MGIDSARTGTVDASYEVMNEILDGVDVPFDTRVKLRGLCNLYLLALRWKRATEPKSSYAPGEYRDMITIIEDVKSAVNGCETEIGFPADFK